MHGLDKILVALDFGSTTESTVRHAGQLARSFASEVILVHAVEYVPYYPFYPYSDKGMSEIFEHCEAELKKWIDVLAEYDVAVSGTYVDEGRGAEVILNRAEALNADAIVIGAGRKGLAERLLVGTTAEKIVRATKLPVFLHHTGDTCKPIRKVLCCVDYSQHSTETLNASVNVAHWLWSHLAVLHVAPEPFRYPGLAGLDVPVVDYAIAVGPELDIENDDADAMEERRLMNWLEDHDLADVEYSAHVRRGRPYEEIQDAVDELQPDLVILGSVGKGAVAEHVFGSTAMQVWREIHSSVLIVKEGAAFSRTGEIRKPAPE
jgi:nucleotide-binding universal stress UspA family protein